MKKIIILMMGICFLVVASCQLFAQTGMKKLRAYNMSKTSIILMECSGIDLFGDERDSEFTTMYDGNGNITYLELRPGGSTSMNSWGDLSIKYPIIIKWAYASHPKEIKVSVYNHIIDLPRQEVDIHRKGSINLVFHQDNFSIIWSSIPGNLHEKEYLEILKAANQCK